MRLAVYEWRKLLRLLALCLAFNGLLTATLSPYDRVFFNETSQTANALGQRVDEAFLAGLLLALSLGAAGLTVVLSQYSGNYIAMLLKAVPLFVAVGAVLGSWLLDLPFTFRTLWDGYGPWVPKGAEAVVAAALLVLGLGLCLLSC